MTTKPKRRETHLVEWKESWRDDYLKWLCGFANADGGTLIVGMNDKGEPVGAADADRLLLDLPNKIRDTLGLVVPVREIAKKAKTARVEGRDHVTDPVGDPVGRLLRLLRTGPLAPSQLQVALGLKHRPTFKENYLRPALVEGLIEMTIPDTPNSRLQKYRLTLAGKERLAAIRKRAK